MGCDSTVVVHLTVNQPVETFITMELCPGESLAIDGEDLTNSGLYTYTYEAQNGCDSTVVIDLLVVEAWQDTR